MFYDEQNAKVVQVKKVEYFLHEHSLSLKYFNSIFYLLRKIELIHKHYLFIHCILIITLIREKAFRGISEKLLSCFYSLVSVDFCVLYQFWKHPLYNILRYFTFSDQFYVSSFTIKYREICLYLEHTLYICFLISWTVYHFIHDFLHIFHVYTGDFFQLQWFSKIPRQGHVFLLLHQQFFVLTSWSGCPVLELCHSTDSVLAVSASRENSWNVTVNHPRAWSHAQCPPISLWSDKRFRKPLYSYNSVWT